MLRLGRLMVAILSIVIASKFIHPKGIEEVPIRVDKRTIRIHVKARCIVNTARWVTI